MSSTHTTPATAAALLAGAQQVIADRGWAPGAWSTPATGQVDTQGALYVAAFGRPMPDDPRLPVLVEAEAALLEVTGTDYLETWDDRPGRTQRSAEKALATATALAA